MKPWFRPSARMNWSPPRKARELLVELHRVVVQHVAFGGADPGGRRGRQVAVHRRDRRIVRIGLADIDVEEHLHAVAREAETAVAEFAVGCGLERVAEHAVEQELRLERAGRGAHRHGRRQISAGRRAADRQPRRVAAVLPAFGQNPPRASLRNPSARRDRVFPVQGDSWSRRPPRRTRRRDGAPSAPSPRCCRTPSRRHGSAAPSARFQPLSAGRRGLERGRLRLAHSRPSSGRALARPRSNSR